MKRYQRNQEKEISGLEISKNLSDYRTPTPEELFLQKVGQEIIKVKPLQEILRDIRELFHPKSMPLFYRN